MDLLRSAREDLRRERAVAHQAWAKLQLQQQPYISVYILSTYYFVILPVFFVVYFY